MAKKPVNLPLPGDGEDDPFETVDPERDKGSWFTAGFDSECSAGGEMIHEGDTIRADGSGGWECFPCVDMDNEWGI